MPSFAARFTVTALAVGAFALLGCGGKGELELAEVEGTLKWAGGALDGVEVAFHPDPELGAYAPVSKGTTDANGKYTLQTAEGKPGAVVGKHRVTLNDPKSSSRPAANPGGGKTPGGGVTDASKIRVPTEYLNPLSTPLKNIEVRSGTNKIPLTVSKTPAG